MTDNTMPERIYAWGANDLPRWSADNLTDDAVEYVRADLVSNESASSKNDRVAGSDIVRSDEASASSTSSDGQIEWVHRDGAWHLTTN